VLASPIDDFRVSLGLYLDKIAGSIQADQSGQEGR